MKETSKLLDRVEKGLRSVGVPGALVEDALRIIPTESIALLMYGSRARGDHGPDSDLDLLALVAHPTRSLHSGPVSLSFYTDAQLDSGEGTLFGVHLARDARILWDPEGRLGTALSAMGQLDTDRLFRRCRALSEVLGALEYDLPKYLPGILREARYLLRSCLYASEIAAGRPCFSVRELAKRHEDPALVALLASRPSGEASSADLKDCLERLSLIIGKLPTNRHGSLEALIVNEWDGGGDLLSMAMMALGGYNLDSDYAEIEKILL